MRQIRPATRRPLLRSLVALAVVVAGSVTWFGLVPRDDEAGGQVAIAAPSSGSPGTAPSPSTAATPSPSSVESVAPKPPSATPVASASTGASVTNPYSTTSSTAGQPRPVVQLPSIGPASAVPSTVQALNLKLRELRATYGMPGISAAILFPDGTMWRATTGFADVKAKRRLTADTEFAVASISKTFLAALTLQLADEGRIALEAPAASYLPSLAIDPRITVHQLLNHTSGLHDYFYDEDIDEALMADRRRVWTATEALAYVGKPYFEPGKGWAYSNTNYVILGLLAESVGGAPLAQQFRERYLVPLGMDHTHYQAVEKPLGPIARGYRFSGPGVKLPPIPLSDGTNVVPFTSVVTAAGSAGSMASTADDLVTWARALYGGNVVLPTSLAAMVSDVAVTAPFKPSIPYGLGVQAATIDGRPTLGHSGRLLGSRSVVRWLPQQGMAIAVLTNQSRNDPNLVARALLRVVLGTPIACTTCTPTR